MTGGAGGYAFVDGLELVPRGTPNPTVHVFNGRSLLTPHADKRFRHLLEGALAKAPELTSKVLPAFNRSRASAPALDTPASLTKHDWKTLSAWYVAQPAGLASDEVDLLLHAHAELKQSPALSQTLDGFNQALLMHRQGYQLPISDPLGFPAYQAFTARVAEALGGATRTVPVPESAFVPIRNGAIEIKKLRLVDTFGRVNDIVASGAAIHPSTWTENNGLHLPPRFVQPLMLDLRWLSARHEGRLSGDHPGTGPICGWLLANALDVTIAVYDADGRACGAIAQTEDQSGRRSLIWGPAPGGASVGNKPLPEAADVPSVALLRVVLKIMTEHGPGANAPPPGAKTEFEELLEDLDVIAENIDPENFEQHQSTALLFGRPFAVVRASVQLRMFGKPAENQSWKAFEKIVAAHWTGTEDDPEHVAAHSAGVRNVKAPVLVGDHNQVNDGVVGYWLESGASLGDFIACLPEDEAVGAGGRPHAFTVALADEPQTLTLLVDPRGKVHAATGILPVKSIDIPEVHFHDALQRIGVTFLATPVLTGLSRVALPLPAEEGLAWSWLWRDRDASAPGRTLTARDFVEAFQGRDPKAIVEALLHMGWLQPGPRGFVPVPKDQRPVQKVPRRHGNIWLDRLDFALSPEGAPRMDPRAAIPFVPFSELGEAVKRDGWPLATSVKFLLSPHLSAMLAIHEPRLHRLLDADLWREIGTQGVLRLPGLRSPLPSVAPDLVWQALKSDGWITPFPDDATRAAVAPIDQRPKDHPALDKLTQTLDPIETLLAATHLVPPATQVAFQEDTMIREGWLKLRTLAPKETR